MNELTINARVERVTYKNPENGYVVLRVRPKNGPMFTAVGYMEDIVNQAALESAEFAFTGTWTISKYGRQFEFIQAKLIGSELLFFLSKIVKGIGEALSKELIAKFGEEGLIHILENDPNRLLKVKGIKHKRLAIILKSWQKHKSLRSLSVYLNSSGVRLTPNFLIRIYNHFGENAINILKENPYNLTEIRGIGFKTADKIAVGIGIGFFSIERIEASIIHVLVEAAEQDGHSYLETDYLKEKLKELLIAEGCENNIRANGSSKDNNREDNRQNKQDIDDNFVSDALIDKSIASLKEKKKIEHIGDKIGLSAYKHMEDWLQKFFKARSVEGRRIVIKDSVVKGFIEEYEDREGIELSEEQREVLFKIALEPRRLFALAGYAGTGKTTVSRAILELLSLYYARPDDIISCAFTGMASSRLRKVTGFNAVTIHSLLKFKGDGQFEHNEKRPIPYSVVLLDEASMVNITLMYRLCMALKDDTLFILVGDPAQLPPIGAGNCFGDALNNGLIPSVTLKKIYRQGPDSVLTVFANEIRQARLPRDIKKSQWKDFAYEEVEPCNIYAAKAGGASEQELREIRDKNNRAIFKRILSLASRYKKELNHPIWEFQVLTPMRMGQLGTEALNVAIQNILNPISSKHVSPDAHSHIIKARGIEIRKGDKVVHLQNRDMPVMDWKRWQEAKGEFSSPDYQRIFNGNTGLVIGINREMEEFYVVYPERIVVAYDFDHIGDIIELAYALTVHKAQGSQYRIVAIPLTNSHFIMLNNKWFYTAITRAEEKVYIIGQGYALKRACTNKQSIRRKTWLSLSV